MGNPRTDWCYKTQPDIACLDVLSIAKGKDIGRQQFNKWIALCKGQPEDFEHWRQLGNEGWAWNDVLLTLKKQRIGKGFLTKLEEKEALFKSQKIELKRT